MKVLKQTLINTIIFVSLCCALIAGAVEACSAWSVASIFLGSNMAMFVCSAILQFSIADAICVFESLFKELADMLELTCVLDSPRLAAWLFLYAVVFYTSFFLLLPITYMNSSFHMSIFAYVYFAKYHHIIPVVVNWLIMPAALTITLNAFNKVWSCITDSAQWMHNNAHLSKAHTSGYQAVLTLASWGIGVMLTLTFSESVYMALHYGVAHYSIMHNTQYALSNIQEALLLSVISLSTFKTMFAVASAGCKLLFKPSKAIARSQEKSSKMSIIEWGVNAWGYFTVVMRAMVRGIQTASIGQGFRQVAVNVIDKGRSNAVAALVLRQVPQGGQVLAKEGHLNNKNSRYADSQRWQLIQALRQFKLC